MSPLTHGISRSTWYLLALIFVSQLALTLVAVLVATNATQESERRWCGVLQVYHEAYATNPAPTTPLGRDIQAQLEQLYADFDCASVKP